MAARKRKKAKRRKGSNALSKGVFFCTVMLCSAASAAASDDAPWELPFVYQNWETFTTRDGLPSDSIRAIHVSGDRVWVGTDGGLAVFDRGGWTSWTHLDSETRVPLAAIWAIDVDDRTRDVWLGTWGEGIIRLSAGRFDRFGQTNSGLAGNLVFDLLIADGQVWVATNGGISSLDPISGTWDLHLERRVDAPETVITSLAFDGRSLYAGAWCGGLWQSVLSASKWTQVEGPASKGITESVSSDPLDDTALAVSLAGESLWWTTQASLFRRDSSDTWEMQRIDGLSPHSYGYAAGGRESPADFVYCLAARSGTEAWLGTEAGLRVLADWPSRTWVTYHACEAGSQGLVTVRRGGQTIETRLLESTIPDNRIRCVAFQGRDVWAGTAHGLARGIGRGRWTGLRPVGTRQAVESRPETCPAPDAADTAGRAHPTPVKPVPIGVLFPLWKIVLLPGQGPQPSAKLGRVDVTAVQLAVEEANDRGGYRGLAPFTVGLDQYVYARWGWNMPEDDFVTLAHVGNARGIVGYLGPDSRFATATALRTEVPLVNAARTAPTIDEIINTWIFRCPVNDPARQKKLLDYILDQLGYTGLALLRTPGRTGQMHLDTWARHARDRKSIKSIRVVDVSYDADTGNPGPALEAIRRSRAEAVLTWCEPEVAAGILRQMRQAGMTQLFVGSEHLVTGRFAELVGCDPGRVIALWNCSARSDEAAAARFARSYEARFKRPPKSEAILSYDAARHLLRAIDVAGLDREAIRRTLTDMGDAFMARLEDGRWLFGAASDR